MGGGGGGVAKRQLKEGGKGKCWRGWRGDNESAGQTLKIRNRLSHHEIVFSKQFCLIAY